MQQKLALFLCLALLGTALSCKREPGRMEKAAGDLKQEVSCMYYFFSTHHGGDAYETAEKWCNSFPSWTQATGNTRGEVSAIVSPGKEKDYGVNYKISRIHIMKSSIMGEVLAITKSDHDEICEEMIDLYGTPTSSTTDWDGYQSLIWERSDGLRVWVYYNRSTLPRTNIDIYSKD